MSTNFHMPNCKRPLPFQPRCDAIEPITSLASPPDNEQTHHAGESKCSTFSPRRSCERERRAGSSPDVVDIPVFLVTSCASWTGLGGLDYFPFLLLLPFLLLPLTLDFISLSSSNLSLSSSSSIHSEQRPHSQCRRLSLRPMWPSTTRAMTCTSSSTRMSTI